jgi:hypothetical protein
MSLANSYAALRNTRAGVGTPIIAKGYGKGSVSARMCYGPLLRRRTRGMFQCKCQDIVRTV